MDGCISLSRHAAIELEWADGDYCFRLGLSEIEELENKTDCGIFQLYQHLSEMRSFRLSMVSQVIRLGLIGGGQPPVDALRLSRKYVDERPIEENRDVAFAIVMAALNRVHGDDIIKQLADEGGTDDDAGKPQDLTSPASTDQPVTSGSAQTK